MGRAASSPVDCVPMTSNRSLVRAGLGLFALLLSAPGCRRAAAPPAQSPAPVEPVSAAVGHLNWVTQSNPPGAQVQQVAKSLNDCVVTCTHPLGAWTRAGCFSVDTDFRFLSTDCGVLVVL